MAGGFLERARVCFYQFSSSGEVALNLYLLPSSRALSPPFSALVFLATERKTAEIGQNHSSECQSIFKQSGGNDNARTVAQKNTCVR